MTRKVLPITNFPHKLFSIVAIVALVALLLAFKPIAKVVLSALEAIGVNVPPVEIFQETAAQILLVALGTLALIVAAVIAVPIIKIAVTVAAVAVIGYGLYNIYQTFTGKGTTSVLPSGSIPPRT